MKRSGLSLAAGLWLFVSSCIAGELPRPIAPTLPVEIVLEQREINVDVDSNAGKAGGMFGGLGKMIGGGVQNARTKEAEARLIPLRDALLGYDFDTRMTAALQSIVSSEDITPAPSISIVTPETLIERMRSATAPPSPALLLMPAYAINERMDTLTVRVVAWYGTRERNWTGGGKSSTLFVHSYAFSYVIDAPDGTARPWLALGTQALEGMMDRAVSQTTQMLAYDFTQQGRAEWARDTSGSVSFKGHVYSGTRIRESDDVLWVATGRDPDRTLQGWQSVSAPAGGPVSSQRVTRETSGKPHLACSFQLRALEDARPRGSNAVALPRGAFTMGDPMVLLRNRLASTGLREDTEGEPVTVRVRHLYIGANGVTLVPVAVYEVTIGNGSAEVFRVQRPSLYDNGRKGELVSVKDTVIQAANAELVQRLNERCATTTPTQ